MTENLASDVAVKKHPGGRPVVYGIDNPCWQILCEQISEGKSLSTAIKAEGMPSYQLVMLTLRNSPEFRTMYEKAVESRADRLAEEIIELADRYAEAYMGRYEQLKKFPEEFHSAKEPVKYLESMKEFVEEARKELPQDTELQNIIDEIADLINSTLYKLRFLN